jgi:hypothetical protein
LSYLYNLFAGSLEDLSARFDAVDLADADAVKQTVKELDPEAYEWRELDEEPLEEGTEGEVVVAALIQATWVPSPAEVLNWLDWHEEDDFLAHTGKVVSDRAGSLLGDLFQAAPLGQSPHEWGFRGSLAHAEVVELRDELAEVLPADVVASAATSSNAAPLADGLPVQQRLAWVYLSLRGVPDGLDVAVRLG